MDEQPDDPGDEAGQVHASRRNDRVAAGKVSRRPQVTVAERLVGMFPVTSCSDAFPAYMPDCIATSTHRGACPGSSCRRSRRSRDGREWCSSSPTMMRPDRSCFAPVAAAIAAARGGATPRRSTARCPPHSGSPWPSWSRTSSDPVASMLVTIESMCCSTPSSSGPWPPSATVSGRTGPAARSAVEKQDPGVLRFDVAELGAQGLGGDLSDLPGEFDAGRSGADQGEGELASGVPPGRWPCPPSRTLRRRGAGSTSASLDRLHSRCPLGVLGWPK